MNGIDEAAIDRAIDYVLSRPIEERLAECLAVCNELPADYSVDGFTQVGSMLLLLCRDRADYETAAEMVGAARLHLMSIKDQESAAIASRIATLALTAGLAAVNGMTVGAMKLDAKKTVGLAALNKAKADAAERARAVAAELWQADTAQEIRLGDMADKVYRALAFEGFAESLPGTPERLREWIKPAAPDYARKGGRRRKTP